MNHNRFKLRSGIIQIIFGCLFLLYYFITPIYIKNASYILLGPGLLSIISGFLSIRSIKNNDFLILSAIFLVTGAVLNFIGNTALSLYTIITLIMAIYNFAYFWKN